VYASISNKVKPYQVFKDPLPETIIFNRGEKGYIDLNDEDTGEPHDNN